MELLCPVTDHGVIPILNPQTQDYFMLIIVWGMLAGTG